MGAGAQGEKTGMGRGGGSSELLGHTGFWGGVYWVALKTAWACLLFPPKGRWQDVSATEGPCRIQPSRPWCSDRGRHFQLL